MKSLCIVTTVPITLQAFVFPVLRQLVPMTGWKITVICESDESLTHQLPEGVLRVVGATLENAARLHAAGVQVGFTQSGDASHNARKVRQLAGNAVANGLPYIDALRSVTVNPLAIWGRISAASV